MRLSLPASPSLVTALSVVTRIMHVRRSYSYAATQHTPLDLKGSCGARAVDLCSSALLRGCSAAPAQARLKRLAQCSTIPSPVRDLWRSAERESRACLSGHVAAAAAHAAAAAEVAGDRPGIFEQGPAHGLGQLRVLVGLGAGLAGGLEHRDHIVVNDDGYGDVALVRVRVRVRVQVR